VRFILAHHVALLAILGAVFLAVTGGEALYADLGHFGRRPIARAWYLIVWPSLLLNYFGQGALLLADPQAVANPFYLLAPGWAQVPLIILAMAATVIASQGVISGVFSVTEQCQRLGCLPRLEVLHSSSDSIGQVYVPAINRLLCFTTLALVFVFGSSAALANAYGIAVASTMLIVTLLELVLMHGRKTRSAHLQFMALAGLCAVDAIFWIGNSSKIAQGGWFPFVFGLVIFFLMQTWYSGRSAVTKAASSTEEDLATFLTRVRSNEIARVPGTAIFMSSNMTGVPRSLVLSVKYNRVRFDAGDGQGPGARSGAPHHPHRLHGRAQHAANARGSASLRHRVRRLVGDLCHEPRRPHGQSAPARYGGVAPLDIHFDDQGVDAGTGGI
jgi:KUP system potassium uptake protein